MKRKKPGSFDEIAWANEQIDRISEPKERTKNIREIAARIGMSYSTLYQKLRGEGAAFKTQELEGIAEYCGTLYPPTAGEPRPSPLDNVVPLRLPTPFPSPAANAVTYRVLGRVEAGAFRDADLLSQVEPVELTGPRNPIYPNATPMAWEVSGDSMNEGRIFDGSIILGVDFHEAGAVLKNNDVVVVQQSRNGLIERSVKAVAIFPDRTEFQPRSTNPAHKPIVFKNGEAEDDVEVKVLSIIHGSFLRPMIQ